MQDARAPDQEPSFAEGDIVISATQLKSFESCNRQWWFNYVQKMPQVRKNHFVFGEVLHAVLERFLKADQNGYDPKTGDPVDLYPEGWATGIQKIKETGDEIAVTLTQSEQALIQILVDKAQEAGLLTRGKGREVEKRFWLDVVEGVWLIGYIDVLYPDEVHDHKSTKNMKYALSPNKLGQDRQMLIYAKAALEFARHRGSPIPEQVTLRHNVFQKDPELPKIRKTEKVVTSAQIEDAWGQVRRLAAQMREVREGFPDLDRWHEVPGPEEKARACNAYGGCAFQFVCGGQETPQAFREKVLRILKKSVESEVRASATLPAQTNKNEGEPNKMDIFKKRLAAREAQKGQIAGAAGTPEVNSGNGSPATATAEAPPPAQEQAQVPANAPPPWARADCAACKGAGVNSKGSACRICDANQRKEGKVTSSNYIFEVVDGEVIWEAKESAPAAAPATVTTTPVTAPAVAEEKSAPATPPAPEVTPEASQPSKLVPKIDTVVPEKKRGRPERSFTLCINCHPVTTKTEIIRLDEVMHKLGVEIAEEFKAESFYQCNTWKRRDAFGMVAAQIAAQLGTAYVTASQMSPDMLALVEVLRPYAQEIIEGIAV